jgi:hypothetical protein
MAVIETGRPVCEFAQDVTKVVTQFREILLWPLQLMPLKEGLQIIITGNCSLAQKTAHGRSCSTSSWSTPLNSKSVTIASS